MKKKAIKNTTIVNIQKIAKVITRNDKSKIYALLKNSYPVDIAEALGALPETTQIDFFKTASIEKAADVLQELPQELQTKIIETLSVKQASDIVEEMDSDEAADLLGDLPKEKAEEIIQDMEPEEADDVTELLSFAEDSAGGIMSKEFISIPEKLTVKQAIARIREKEPPDNNAFSYIYVVNSENKLVGFVSIRDLVLAKPSKKIKSIRNNNVVSVSIDTDQETVAQIISKYDLNTIPVIDYRQRIAGIVTIDDVLDIIEEETTEDILRLSGTNLIDEETLLKGSVLKAVFSRIPWLFLTIFGGLLAALVINHFSPIIAKLSIPITIIMSFVPLLIGMAGNIGTQSSTIVVRGIATGHIKNDQALKNILREAFIGLIIGITLGLLAMLMGMFWHADLNIGLIVGIAMCLNVIIAAVLGAFIPLGFWKIGIDPAIASGPMITTTIDTIGLVVYFTITLAFLKSLL